MSEKYQVMPELSPEEYQTLKTDIAEHGVLVPVEKDENGDILDGYHRVRAWEELRADGVKLQPYPVLIRAGLSEYEKLNHARSVNILRRHLTKEQRTPILIEMRQSGMSYRTIAEVAGVSLGTIENTLAGVQNNTPATIRGKDGKHYPSKKPRTPKTIITSSGKAEERIQEAIQKVGAEALPDKVIYDKRAERVCREAESNQRRENISQELEAHPEITRQATYDLRLGRFQDVLIDIKESSVDLICTDPPYGNGYLTEWDDLAALAIRVLKPSGWLVTYAGQAHLPKFIKSLSQSLTYVWTIAQINGSSKKNIIQYNQIYSQWKPILLFCKEPLKPITWTNDTLQGITMEKDFHDWQQGKSESDYFLQHFSMPGNMVIDPFLGSGTTAVSAKKLQRYFIGCDIDAANLSKCLERLNNGSD